MLETPRLKSAKEFLGAFARNYLAFSAFSVCVAA
jgi:hypothetical protein